MRLAKCALGIAALAMTASSAHAQAAPYKLVILWRDNIAVVDYPSLARCNAALAVLEKRKQSEAAERQPQRTPGGGVVLPAPWLMDMVCIPA